MTILNVLAVIVGIIFVAMFAKVWDIYRTLKKRSDSPQVYD